jgi:hypothetical protein
MEQAVAGRSERYRCPLVGSLRFATWWAVANDHYSLFSCSNHSNPTVRWPFCALFRFARMIRSSCNWSEDRKKVKQKELTDGAWRMAAFPITFFINQYFLLNKQNIPKGAAWKALPLTYDSFSYSCSFAFKIDKILSDKILTVRKRYFFSKIWIRFFFISSFHCRFFTLRLLVYFGYFLIKYIRW